MLNFNSRPKQSLLRPFLAMISASSLALIGVIAVPAATETASAETVFSIDGEAEFDQSGYSVALSGDGSRVAIGATGNDGNGDNVVNSGHVRIYDLVDGAWTKVGSDIDGEAAFDYSGLSVALSSNGSRVAIGAYSNDGNGSNAGHVRIYDYNGSSWTQVGVDIDGEAAGDSSGYSVALSSDGSRVAIGARSNDGDNVVNSGHVRIYDLVDGAWTKVGADIDGEAARDFSGWSVALSSDGSRVAIGATGNDGNGDNAGTVILFRLFELKSALTPTFGTPTNTRDGFTTQVSNFDAGFSWNVSVSAGSAVISGTGLITVTGLSAGDSSTVTVSTTRSGYSAGSAKAESAVDKKLTVGSFKGFIAIYTKGYEGSKLSAKVAGKWLVVDSLDESWRGNDYSRTVRFTGAGYDIFVHLYIDGEYIRTDELTTK